MIGYVICIRINGIVFFWTVLEGTRKKCDKQAAKILKHLTVCLVKKCILRVHVIRFEQKKKSYYC